MSVPPSTTVRIEVQPVFGAVIVCLAQCLRLNGLIDQELEFHGTDFCRLGDAAVGWAGDLSPDGFWREIAAKGCSRQSADACARQLGGACIGWSEQIYPQKDTAVRYPPHNRVCTDLNVCLAVLSRRVGNLFLSYRPPDYSPEQLLHWAFVADDSRLAPRSISWEQWPLQNQQKPRPNDSPLNPVCWQGGQSGFRSRYL
jgi:hypothetical protein